MMLDAGRVKRYREKMAFILERIENLPVDGLSALERDGVYYRLATSIDASMDVIAMMVKDRGWSVGDDYDNIDKIEDLGILPTDLCSSLRTCNGLRNVLIHKYNGVKHQVVFDSIVEVQEIMGQFIEHVEVFLDGHGQATI